MTKQVLLAYYDGAYGPTLRIDVQSLEDLTAIRQVFGGLASGDIREADFVRALNCRLDSMHSLIVRSVLHRASKVLRLDHLESTGPSFLWSNTAEDWVDCAEMADVLLKHNTPGHQYLTSEGVDDALVELCYLEAARQP
jgi:hypothetical protein